MAKTTIKQVKTQTLVAVYGSFPYKNGNCFSVTGEDGNCYKIVNFCIENYNVIAQKLAKIEIKILAPNVAAICDSRISGELLQEYCPICCPKEYL